MILYNQQISVGIQLTLCSSTQLVYLSCSSTVGPVASYWQALSVGLNSRIILHILISLSLVFTTIKEASWTHLRLQVACEYVDFRFNIKARAPFLLCSSKALPCLFIFVQQVLQFLCSFYLILSLTEIPVINRLSS